jgi:hypothetical protein
MPVEIEKEKVGRSSGNYGTVTKPASVSASSRVAETSSKVPKRRLRSWLRLADVVLSKIW